jgi:hypothetical protein
LVQGLLSLQTMGLLVQAPPNEAKQMSAVQAFPSLQIALLCTHPKVATQLSPVQGLPSSQDNGG